MTRVPPSLRAARNQRARREAPAALALAGTVAVLLVAIDLIQRGFVLDRTDPGQALMIAAFVVAWLLVRSRAISDAAVPWVIAIGAAFLVGTLLNTALLQPLTINLAYCLLAMLAYSPFVLNTVAMLVAAVPMVVGYAIACMVVAPDEIGQWLLAGFAALFIGFAIQRVRLRGIDELAQAHDQLHQLATRDGLTGVLNRPGLDEALPGLLAGAERHDESVFAVFVDVDGLKVTNDERGHDVGDGLIVSVADVLRSHVRANDLVARWGGDEFLIVGTGAGVDAGSWEDRLNAELAERADGDGGAHVSVGTAHGPAAGLDIDRLLRAADEQMYARRRMRRAET